MIVCLSGRGDKDVAAIAKYRGRIINEKSGGRTPSANANALAGTPEANSRSSTDNSITENAEKSNLSDENSSKNPLKKRFALNDNATEAPGFDVSDGSIEFLKRKSYKEKFKKSNEIVIAYTMVNTLNLISVKIKKPT